MVQDHEFPPHKQEMTKANTTSRGEGRRQGTCIVEIDEEDIKR